MSKGRGAWQLPYQITIEVAPLQTRGWRAGMWICTDHRTSSRSTVELGSEFRVKEFAEL